MSLRYTVAAAALLLGLAMVATGLSVSPQVTVERCTQTGSASQNGSVQTTSPDCTVTTEPAPGQRRYLLGLGFAVFLFGVVVVLGDLLLAR